MNRYTIQCTEEQTKRALKLGASITKFCGLCPIVLIGDLLYDIPTAEQMIGWLEEQKIFVHIAPCADLSCSWLIASQGCNGYEYTSNIMVCKTRKEAN